MSRKGRTRWRRSSHARRLSRRRTTARFPHRGAIRGCGTAARRDERAGSKRSADGTKVLLADCREVTFPVRSGRTPFTTKPVTKKGALLSATRWKHRTRLLLPAAQRSAGPPMLRSPRTGAWGAKKYAETRVGFPVQQQRYVIIPIVPMSREQQLEIREMSVHKSRLAGSVLVAPIYVYCECEFGSTEVQSYILAKFYKFKVL